MQNSLISMEVSQSLPAKQEKQGRTETAQHNEQPINSQQNQLSTALIVVNMANFLSMELPERGFLLEPVIPTQGIVILYAPRGIGKTFTALSMSLAVAGGLSLYNWQASKPNKVLYVDGEMPATTMQERLKALALGMGAPEIAMQICRSSRLICKTAQCLTLQQCRGKKPLSRF